MLFRSSYRQTGLALTGLALLAASVGCRSAAADDAPAGTGPSSAGPPPSAGVGVAGTSNEYALTLESRADFAPGKGAAASAFGFTLSGTLAVASGAERGPLVERFVTLKNASIKQGAEISKELEPLARELEKPWVVTFHDGQVTELQFSRGLSGQAAALLRTISAALQFPAVDAGRATVVREYDATGQYEAEYRADGDGFVKKKTRYTALLTTGPISDGQRTAMMPRVIESRATLRFESGVLASFRSQETLESDLMQGKPIASKTVLALILSGSSPPAPNDRNALQADNVKVAASAPYGSAPRGDHFDEVRIQGLTIQKALTRFYAARKKVGASRDDAKAGTNGTEPSAASIELQREDFEAFAAVVALVRRDPAALGVVVSAIPTSPGDRKKALYDVLGNAGTPEAQRELIRIVKNHSAPDADRRAAAMSLIRVKLLTQESVAALRESIDDPSLLEHAIYGLGTAARRLREADRMELADEIRGVLGSLMDGARDDLMRLRVARGIANSADPNLLPRVRPLFSSESVKLRQVALQAVQHMPVEEVDPLIAKTLKEDTSPVVRATAATVAGTRQHTMPLVDALTAAAKSDADRTVRYKAVEALSTWLDRLPELRPALAAVVQNESEAKTRDLARRALEKK